MYSLRFSVALLCAIIPIAPTYAVDSKDAQIKDLLKRVETLESKVNALESGQGNSSASGPLGALPDKPAVSSAKGSGYLNQSNWDRLEKGMSKNAVQGVLGKPTSETTISVGLQWTYGEYPAPWGYVAFDKAGNLGAWMSPSFAK